MRVAFFHGPENRSAFHTEFLQPSFKTAVMPVLVTKENIIRNGMCHLMQSHIDPIRIVMIAPCKMIPGNIESVPADMALIGFIVMMQYIFLPDHMDHMEIIHQKIRQAECQLNGSGAYQYQNGFIFFQFMKTEFL